MPGTWNTASAAVGRIPRRMVLPALALAVCFTTQAKAQGFQDDLQALVGEIAARTPAPAPLPFAPALALDPATALAQADPQQEEAVPITADQVTLNFQDADIGALVSTVSQITGRNFIVDPRVKGKVTLVSGTRLATDQIYDIFLSVLEVHGFAAVDAGGMTKILPANIIKQVPTRTNFGETLSPTDEQVTQVYSLRHASVQELTPILRPLLPPTSHFAPHIGSNTLVFTDTAANVARVLDIVRTLDKPDSRSDIHVVLIRYAGAARLAEIVRQVAQSLEREIEGAAAQPVSVQVDEGLNALVIQAPEAQFLVLDALIAQLDVERAREENVHVVYLRYAKAADLVPLLNEIASSRADANEEEGARGVPISVQADEDTNALVIRARQDHFEELSGVIEKLDLRRSQVFVETILAEVSNSKAAEIGVEWQGLKSKSSGGEISGSQSFSDSSGGGLTVGVINKFVTDLAGNIVPDLNIVLRLLREDSNVNILSTPNLLTLDNESAEIVVGQEVPFVTGQYVNDASSTTDTGSDGNTAGVVNPFQTIERKDVGLTLKITPQINEGGAIRLEIEQEVSSVSQTTVAGAADLITDTRSINATVLVDDGQIIVLGGLITDDFSDTFEWVPVLGKIPVIGALFRKKGKRAIKRNLMVFLRPKIIRTPSDLYEHTSSQYANLQEAQRLSLPDTRRLIPEAEVPVLPEINTRNK